MLVPLGDNGGALAPAVEAGTAFNCSKMSSGRPAREPPAFTVSSIVGNFTVPASRGARIAAICASLSARTRRNSPNIFMFSS